MSEIAACGALAAGSMLISYFMVVRLQRWTAKRMLDIPNERSCHSHPTPRGGGLAIVICTLVGMWLACPLFSSAFPFRTVELYGLGALLIALVGWIDDLRSLPNSFRFGTQTVGALLILVFIGSWSRMDMPFFGTVSLGWSGFPICFLWIVGLTNAYNFMDGIDGIAGGQAVVAGLAWVGLGASMGYPLPGILGALLVGGSLGFLKCNWPPARIFMGDVGSAFLGYTLACLPIITDSANPRLPLAGILVVWPFVLDTIFTLLCRLSRGENIFTAHRSHLYQRLVIAGLSHRTVTLVYIGLAFIGAILAYVWVMNLRGCDWLVFFLPLLLFFCLWLSVVRSECGNRAAGRRVSLRIGS